MIYSIKSFLPLSYFACFQWKELLEFHSIIIVKDFYSTLCSLSMFGAMYIAVLCKTL